MYKYNIPYYYESFVCKCGDCRHPCCIGWKISVGQDEYFRLIGRDCSEKLRRSLDRAFVRCENPSPESFVEVVHDWYGRCPIMDENGLCSLQVECGEEAIPRICRYYPRSARACGNENELFCATSCEKTVELLTSDDRPYGFCKAELCTEPAETDTDTAPETYHKINHIRDICIGTLSNRKLHLKSRIINLRGKLELLQDYTSINTSEIDILLKYTSDDEISTDITPDSLRNAFDAEVKLVNWFAENSASIADYINDAYETLGLDEITDEELDSAYLKYRGLSCEFDKKYPRWEVMLEKLLINHLCFCEFPVRTRGNRLSHTALSLCAVYCMLRFLLISCTASDSSYERFVDIVSAAFRLMDHTRFDSNSVIILNKLGYTDYGKPDVLMEL